MSGRYRFRRRSGWRSSYGRARSRYNRARTSIIKRAKGNARAANAQADTTDVVINLMHSCITMVQPSSMYAPANNSTMPYMLKNTLPIGTCAINIFNLLAKSDFFNCYAPMYDQFRITSIKVKIVPTKWATYDQQVSGNNYQVLGTDHAANGNVNTDETADLTDLKVGVPGSEYQYPQSLTVVTAWDRTGLSDYQFDTLKNLINNKKIADGGNAYTDAQFTEELKQSIVNSLIQVDNPTYGGLPTNLQVDQYIYGFFTNIGDTITTYSSAQTKQLIAGQSFNCTRYLYPQNQQEKSVFYSTNNLEPTFEKSPNSIMYTTDAPAPEGEHIEANDLRDRLCSLSESPNIPFKPTLLIGVLGDSEVQAEVAQHNNVRYIKYLNKIRPIKFNCEFDIGVTFRGLRKTQVV